VRSVSGADAAGKAIPARQRLLTGLFPRRGGRHEPADGEAIEEFARLIEARRLGDFAAGRAARRRLVDLGWNFVAVEPREDRQ
jgi:hypothetical protein